MQSRPENEDSEKNNTGSQMGHYDLKKSHSYLLYGFTVSGLIALIVVLAIIDPDTRDILIQEDGPIEALSAIGYFVCLIPLLRHKETDAESLFCIAVFLMIFGMRELDFHARFTTMSMTKIEFYVSPHVPIFEKMIGVAVFVLLCYCFIYLSKKYLLAYVQAVKRLEAYAIGVSLSFLFVMISLGLDGLEKKAAKYGYAYANQLIEITTVIEEVVELGVPVMFLIAILTYFNSSDIPST